MCDGGGHSKAALWGTDRISLALHSGVIFVTVLGSPQTGPRGPHMVQVQKEIADRSAVLIIREMSYEVMFKECASSSW